MYRASISETKNTLSALLARVQAGETVIIENRGTPVAQIQPLPSEDSTEGRLERLIRAGVIRPRQEKIPRDILFESPPKALDDTPTSALVIEERRSGW